MRAAPSDAPTVVRGRRYDEDRLHLLVRDPGRVLAVWEIRRDTAVAAASRAAAAGVPLRYMLRIERDAGEGTPGTVIAAADLPDAEGGEGWYLAIPPKAGRCRAILGLDLGARFEPILTSRWAPTPPDGPCDAIAAWPLGEGGETWVAREWREAHAPGGPAGLPSSSARYLPRPDARPAALGKENE